MSAESFEALQCGDCDAIFTDDDAGEPVYECGECGSTFTRDEADGTNRCPNDGRFSGKVSDYSCPECASGEVENVDAYECDGDGCGDRFTSIEALEEHERACRDADEEPAPAAAAAPGRGKCSECSRPADRGSVTCYVHRLRYGPIEVHERPDHPIHIVPVFPARLCESAEAVTDDDLVDAATGAAFSAAVGGPCSCGGRDYGRVYVGAIQIKRDGSVTYAIADGSRYASIDYSGIKV